MSEEISEQHIWEHLVASPGDGTHRVLARRHDLPQWWHEVALFYDPDRAASYAAVEAATGTVAPPPPQVTPPDRLPALAVAERPAEKLDRRSFNKQPDKSNSWNTSEDAVLQPWLDAHTIDYAALRAKLPGRSNKAISARIERLRRRQKPKPALAPTADEIAALEAQYCIPKEPPFVKPPSKDQLMAGHARVAVPNG